MNGEIVFFRWNSFKRNLFLLVVSGIALVCSLLKVSLSAPFDLAWVAIILCGTPIIIEAFVGLATRFDVTADVLVAAAVIAAVLLREEFAAGEVAFIMRLGSMLEEFAVSRARSGIERLVKMSPLAARRIIDGKELVIPADDVRVGDTLRALPGETIPVDGVILKGRTSINQAVITGESIPVDKLVGDEVFSGTVNMFGAFEMRATKVGRDSSIQRTIRLARSSEASKTKIVRAAERWTTVAVFVALGLALATWGITGNAIRAATVLIVFCPCSFVLAAPTAITAAIGNATRRGFLLKEGDAFERLSKVKLVAFDKTGTLTSGSPKVKLAIAISPNFSDEDVFRFAASVERLSEHPLGKAIVASYIERRRGSLPLVEDFETLPGLGVRGRVEGRLVMVGNEKFLSETGATLNDEAIAAIREQNALGRATAPVAIDGSLVGFLALADDLRSKSKKLVSELDALGISSALLTGDRREVARQIGAELGIRDVRSELTPEDKLSTIDEYQREGIVVCMVGDGVNDAPALKRASAGLAMGRIGSDLAVEAADGVIVEDKVEELPRLLELARKTVSTIRFNILFSLAFNLVATSLAALGALDPMIGALIHNAGSIFVVANSASLLNYGRQKAGGKFV